MSSRIRSRAFDIKLCGHYRDAYNVLLCWIQDNGSEWLVAYDKSGDLPYHIFYIRFKSPRDIKNIQSIFSDMNVSPSTKSFKQMKSLYSSILKIDLCSDYRRSMCTDWNAWQQSVLRYITTKLSMGSVTWVHYGYKTKDFMYLFRHLALMDPVMFTTESDSIIKEKLKQKALDNKEFKAALVINLPQSRELSSDLFEFLEEVRMGVITECSRSYVFDPMNVVVFSTSMPDLLVRKQYQMNVMSINSIYELE